MFARVSRRVHHVVAAVPALVAVGALTLGLSGCAKHPTPNPDAATHQIIIQVNNNVVPVVLYTIWVQETPGGSRQRLGDAPGNRPTSLPFTPRLFGQQFTLTAVPPLGTNLSRTFSIDNEGITMLKWSLRENVLSYFGAN
jgi:hypothetical protein